MRTILLASVATVSVQAVKAASITWGPATTMSADTDVSTSNTFDRAYIFGNSSVINGVNFSNFFSQTTDFDSFSGGGTSFFAPNGIPVFTNFDDLSPAYQTLAANARFGDDGFGNIILQNLIPGLSYEIQTWVNDSRDFGDGGINSRVTAIGGSPYLDYNVQDGKGGVGQFATGTFTADAAGQGLSISANVAAQINGLQLRVIPVINSGMSGTVNSPREWSTITINGGGSLTYNLATTSTQKATTFSGGGTFSKFGPGNLNFGGLGSVDVNFSPGALIDVQQGTLTASFAGGGNWLGNLASVNVASGGARFKTGDASVTIDSLSGGGVVEGGFTGTRTIVLGAANGSAIFGGVIQDDIANAGVLSITKSGSGTQTFQGINTYTGSTLVSAGVLLAERNTALGGTAAGTTVTSGATLGLAANVTINEPLFMSGSGYSGTGALHSISGGNTWTGAITLNGTSTITADSGSSLQINTAIQESALGYGLIKIGSGPLTLMGVTSNTYTGPTQVNEGTLTLAKAPGSNAVGGDFLVGNGGPSAATVFHSANEQIPNTANVTVNGPLATLDFGNYSETMAGLSITDGTVATGFGSSSMIRVSSLTMTSGTINIAHSNQVMLSGNMTTNASASAATITGSGNGALDLQGATCTFTVADGAASSDLIIEARITNGGVDKYGPGKMVLLNAQSYGGATDIHEGTLAVDGSLSGTTITVDAGASLGGSGTINAAITMSGTLAPGNSPGTTTVNGPLTLAGGSELSLEINGTTAGTTYDQLILGAGGSLLSNDGTFTLSLGFIPSIAQTFLVIDNLGGSSIAQFGNAPDGMDIYANYSGDVYAFNIDYQGGDGNDVVLTAVPEPGAAMSLLSGAVLMLGLRRRRALRA